MNIVQFAQFVFGLLFLVAGAELLVRSAAGMARDLGVAPVIVGLTVVAFGTSAPELAISIRAVLAGQGAIAVGNVVGSNIANLLLIIGLAAAIVPLRVSAKVVRHEVPIMVVVSLLAFLLAANGVIGRAEGLLLVVLLVAYVAFQVFEARRANRATRREYAEEYPVPDLPHKGGTLKRLALLVAGLGVMLLGANWLVESASALARALGVSELVIGLTIVAVGTSAPELATSLVAAQRGQRDIAVGNAIGSNVFNLLCVLGITAFVAPAPLQIPQAALAFDLPVMVAAAIACLPIFWTRYTVRRWEGLLFLAYYAVYLAWLLLSATAHEMLPRFSTAMLFFVVPLTALGLLFSLLVELRRRRSERVVVETTGVQP